MMDSGRRGMIEGLFGVVGRVESSEGERGEKKITKRRGERSERKVEENR